MRQSVFCRAHAYRGFGSLASTSSTISSTGHSLSLRAFEAGSLDDGVEFVRFRFDIALERLRAAAADRLRALAKNRILDVGHGERLRHAVVDAADDGRRHAGGREQAAPAYDDDARIAGLDDGRRLRKLLVARFTQGGDGVEVFCVPR